MPKKKWEDLFTSFAVRRGRNNFYSSRVHNLKYTDHGDILVFQADVKDGSTYHVTGQFEGDELTDIKCSCLESLHSNCSHMVSTIMALEYEQEIAEERNRRKEAEAAEARTGTG